MTVGFSYNPYWVGKPVKQIEPWTDPKTGKVSNRPFMYYEGNKVNLGYKWKNIELSWADAFDSITKDGYSFAPVLIGAAHGHKNEDNFLSHSIVAVDIDSGMKISGLLKDELYNKYGAGFYTSPSHKNSAHRFRILFRPQQRITDVYDMRHLYTALIKWYGGDAACIDGARLFFGTVNAPLYERTDKVLPLNITMELIKHARDEMAQRMLNAPPVDYKPPTDHEKEQILDLLQRTYVGKYPAWLKVGWGLRAGGFTFEDFARITNGFMKEKSVDDARHVWDSWDPNATNSQGRKITLGSVYGALREAHGTLPWETKQVWGRRNLKIK